MAWLVLSSFKILYFIFKKIASNMCSEYFKHQTTSHMFRSSRNMNRSTVSSKIHWDFFFFPWCHEHLKTLWNWMVLFSEDHIYAPLQKYLHLSCHLYHNIFRAFWYFSSQCVSSFLLHILKSCQISPVWSTHSTFRWVGRDPCCSISPMCLPYINK